MDVTLGSQVGPILLLILMGLSLLATVLGLPGTLILWVLAFIYAWITGFQVLTWGVLLILAAMALLAETADQLLSLWGARRHGASFKGMLGSMAGALVGALLLNAILPLIGGLIGAFLGAYAGALLVERRVQGDWESAHRAAWGGFLGRAAGIVVKLILGAAMIGVVAWQLYG